jgi:hypothetical protein
MRVSIVKTRAKHFSRTIYNSVEHTDRSRRGNAVYFAAIYGQEHFVRGAAVVEEYIGILKKYLHF